MATVITYQIRSGNGVPLLCNGSSPSEGNIVFTFGTETQEVINCSFDSDVITSKDMCLLGGDYYSATYKALPGKVGGKLVFNSTLMKKPIRSAIYPKCNEAARKFGG